MASRTKARASPSVAPDEDRIAGNRAPARLLLIFRQALQEIDDRIIDPRMGDEIAMLDVAALRRFVERRAGIDSKTGADAL